MCVCVCVCACVCVCVYKGVYICMSVFRACYISNSPCLQLVHEVAAMHADIQPLKIFHFGGDEVPEGAWEKSPACEGGPGARELKQTFVEQVGPSSAVKKSSYFSFPACPRPSIVLQVQYRGRKHHSFCLVLP